MPLPSCARLPRLLALLSAGLLVSGCIVLPRVTAHVNPACNAVERHVTLEAQQIGVLGGCRNNADCAGLLAIYGLVAAGSAVVSGSVAIVGNVAYWVEKQAQCVRGAVSPSSPAAPAASAASG